MSNRRTAEVKVKDEQQDVESFDIPNDLSPQPTNPKNILTKKSGLRSCLSLLQFALVFHFCGSAVRYSILATP